MRVDVTYDRLDESQRSAHRAIEGALRDGALETQAGAQRIVPVDTGRLRASITTRDSGPLNFEVYTNVDYAGYVEWGTRYMAAQPYMRPAYERYRLPTIERARAALQNI